MAIHLNKSLAILRRKQVQARTGLGKSSVYALMAEGKFPKSIKISARAVGWLESDIDDFIASRIAASHNPIKGA